MRFLPRTARHRLAAATAACTLALGALAAPHAVADDHLKHREKHVQKQIRHAGHDLDESSAELRHASALLARAVARLEDAKDELAVSRAKLTAAQVRDREMQAELDAAVQRLADARAQLLDGQQAVADQRDHVTGTIVDVYEKGDPRLLAIASLMNSETTSDLTRRASIDDVIVGKETRAYDDLHAAEVLLQVHEDEVEAAKDAVATQREAAAAHLVTMRELHAETAAAADRVRALVRSRLDARSAAATARRHDQATLQELKQREARIRERILAAARRAARKAARAKHPSGYHGSTGGFLSQPVPGVVTSPFGYREHPIYHYWGLHDGTDFGVSCGEPMRAVASGTVMSRYWSDVYGNRLYLNVGTVNGKNLTVIYNHASGYRVGVGQHVSRGQTVGYVGSTGWSTGCHLHFTVMVNGSPVDPMNWM